MQSKIIFVIFSILLLSVTSCYAGQEPDSSQNNKETGDIMVVARGCTPPPYETGLKLALNKMPELTVPLWVRKIPDSLISQPENIKMIVDSLGHKGVLLQIIFMILFRQKHL